ncbi:lasso peptide biosynthesis protein [Polymorphospora sp. NPDC051019]|uniref:lasso peptide biosynthesis protein n=1 Tax=Polymorphospora sp. NPDC051019 TaxID=3155725 RepID=UPI003446A289
MGSGPLRQDDLELDGPLLLVECPVGPAPARTPSAPDPHDGSLPASSAPGVHWADYDGDLIALDLRTDRFVALGAYASAVVSATLGTPAAPGPRDGEVLAALARRGLLTGGPAAGPWSPARPARPGGVTTNAPRPLAGVARTAPAARPGLPLLLAARSHLLTCERELRRDGLSALLADRPAERPARPDDLPVAARLVRAHLAVRRLWSRPQHPMAAPAALARHAWRVGLPVRLVVGVQKHPLHSRAFVELRGTVLDDDPELAGALAPILVVGPEGEAA